MFVRAIDHECSSWGIGKAEHMDNDHARVLFFDSPVTEPILVELPSRNLQKVDLSKETRIYWQDDIDASWRVGRVLYADSDGAEIRFPNKVDRFLSTEDIYVRWDRPISDPTDYLAHKINETPLFAQARSNFVEALTAQRAACQGMTGLISSIIDIEPHQVEVVRRILQDPVQRYLLADEVGLGKTIEAGVLIRQYVLDDPLGHNVVILVPPSLIAQWRYELVHRFLLEVQLDDSIHVLSLNEPILNLNSLIKCAGMLVIDEAHHISRDRSLYNGLRETITSVPRLFLLSATPVLHNERGFLEMLHLLDPKVYPLEQEEMFRQRIEHRQMLAEIVAGLVPENLLQLDLFLDRLIEHFDQDDLLKNHVERLRVILIDFPEVTDQTYIQALHSLRAHLSETYRLDRRILRNRRNNVPGLTPTRVGVTFIDYSSNLSESLVIEIERWRSHVVAEIYGSEDTPKNLEIAKWFSVLISSLLTDPDCIVELVNTRIKLLENSGGDSVESISSEIPYLIDVLNAAQGVVDETDRYAALANYLKQEVGSNTKFVIFCSEAGVADRLVTYLEQHQESKVERHVDYMAEDAMESPPWLKFLDDPDHRILVCDSHAEEGLNLQGGDKVIVHFDLSMAPNRIEQRIGRVDRYGSGSAIRSLVLRCIDNPFEMTWASFLDKGLGVFRYSIASLQYLIEDEISRLSRMLLIDGLEAITLLTESMSGSNGLVEKELRRIDEQDDLDALTVPPEESLDELFDVDSDWRGFSQSVDQWLVATLRMGKVSGPNVGHIPDTIFRFRMNCSDRGVHTLLPLSKFIMHFISTLDVDARQSSSRNLITFPYTCRRETALMRSSLENNVRLLRLGEPFLDGLVTLTSQDDRGRSVAMWRHVPGYKADEKADIFIRFDFIVDADIDKAADYYSSFGSETFKTARYALARRGDMAFPPFFQTIWLDGSMRLVDDEKLLTILSQPYNKDEVSETNGITYHDKNLNSKRWQDVVELGLPVMDYWSEWVVQARDSADTVLRQHTSMEERSKAAKERAMLTDSGRFAQLKTRVNCSSGTDAEIQKQFLDLELSVANALYEGILHPKIMLDTISAVFISGESLLTTKSHTSE